MSSAPKRRFAGHGRGDGFPAPELSLGKHLQKLPNGLQVWDAVGPALALFDQLSLEIKNHLNKFSSSIKDEVRWTLCMVGRSRAASRPVVVFLSPDTRSRQTVKEQVKSSGILKGYPGFVTMDCNRPPGCAEMVSLATSHDNIDMTASDSDHTSRRHAAIRPGKLKATVVVHAAYDTTDAGEHKRATAGGLLRCGEDFFVMTVAHIFPGYAQGAFPSTARCSEFEYEIDAWSDNEDTDMGTDDLEIEQMSEASISTPSSDSDDAQFWGTSQSAPSPVGLEVNNIGDSSQSSIPTRDRRNAQCQVHKAGKVGHTGDHISGYPQDFSVDVEMRGGNLERITQQPFISLDSQGQLLDYALLPISSSQLDTFTGEFARELHDRAKVPDASSGIIETRSRTTVDVVAKTASGGNISGQLLGAPTFMKRAHSETYQELWTVALQKHLEIGDSGSWIYDTKTGEVYGHLIAGSPGTAGFGYVVPMVNVLEDLQERFPGTWQIFARNTDDVRSDIPSSIPSSTLGSPFRPPDHSHPIPPLKTGDLYTAAPQHLSPTFDILTRSPSANHSGVLTPATSKSGFTGPVYSMDSSLSGSQYPPLFPTEVIYCLQTSDGQQIAPEIFGRIDKGFFLSDNDWTCYRRNYFSVVCSFTLQPSIPTEAMFLVKLHGGVEAQVHSFAMSIAAVVDGREGNPIELVQHAPKRDRGPQEKPDRITVAPRRPTAYGLQGDSRLFTDTQFWQIPNTPPFEAIFERIQFKNATANNGKRRAKQQYFHLLVELFADVEDEPERWVKVASRMSAPMVVRGRSPGHYQLKNDGGVTASGGRGSEGSLPGSHTPGGSVAREKEYGGPAGKSYYSQSTVQSPGDQNVHVNG